MLNDNKIAYNDNRIVADYIIMSIRVTTEIFDHVIIQESEYL